MLLQMNFPNPRHARRAARSSGEELAHRGAAAHADEQPRPRGRRAARGLVVYGGIGKAARNWECYDAIIESLKRLEIRRFSCSPEARRRAQDPRRCTASAHRELQPGAELGELGALQRARPQGPHDVRADDRRLVDLHRQPGHRAGHLRDLRRGGPQALRRRLVGKWILTAGLGGMGGPSRSPRPWPAPRCSPSSAIRRASRCGSSPATSTRRPRASTKP